MAEEDDAPEDGEDASGEEKKKGGLMKLGLMIGAPLVLLLGGGGAAYVFFFSGGEEAGQAQADGEYAEGEQLGEVLSALERGPGHVLSMSPIVVSISGANGRIVQVQLTIQLEYADEAYGTYIEDRKPWLRDQFIGFMRGLHESDISQSDGHYRLERELARRANLVLDPVSIEGVLITDLYMQAS